MMERTVAEFFAGIGLVRLGLENQGWKVVFANDIDPKKYEMYSHHFPNADLEYRLDDIRCLNADDIPTVTLATASFPCNDLSLAGRYQGLAGEHSSTIWKFLDLLREMGTRKPPLVLLENVVSFISSHHGQDFQNVLSALNELGYMCDALIIDAVRFVPQSRPRLFVIASQLSTQASLPITELQPSDVRPVRLVSFIQSHPEIHWQLLKTPALPNLAFKLPAVLEDIPSDSELWWSQERAVYLLNQMSERHRHIADLMIAGDTYSYGTVFRRVRYGRSMGELRVDGIAGCLRTPRGGSGRQILFKAGQGAYFVRLLTPRECARLQGVPDNFPIRVPLNQALFGFGDAVCVSAIEWIAQNYLNRLLENVDYPTSSPKLVLADTNMGVER
jgi:DNA (cytosine-5)-methyltransferase 1